MPDNLRRRQEVIVTAIPLHRIFALMVTSSPTYSVRADNWLVPNPRLRRLHRHHEEGAAERLQPAQGATA